MTADICAVCGHPITAHSDRAFIPCISDEQNGSRCGCPGYSTRQTDVNRANILDEFTAPAA